MVQLQYCTSRTNKTATETSESYKQFLKYVIKRVHFLEGVEQGTSKSTDLCQASLSPEK